MEAIGPVPFAGMVLADLGADIVRLDRISAAQLGVEIPHRFLATGRSKRSVAVDLKSREGLAVARRLIAASDVLIEGFRPVTMERLGLGPDVCLADNPKLVFARCSGWGESGPLANIASHDINYIGLSGALAALGVPDQPPTPPLSLVGDYGGAGMQLVCGTLAALISARMTGRGQVIHTSIAQGALSLMPIAYSLLAAGHWTLARGANLTDGGAPYYRCYETSDGHYMAVGAIENRFYAELLAKLDIADAVDVTRQSDRSLWPATAQLLAARFKQRSRAEWMDRFKNSDACVTPVLDMSEAPHHAQHVEARGFVDVEGVIQPAPGVRFSRTELSAPHPAPARGANTQAILSELGFSPAEITGLSASGAVRLG
jgi:alpha-methylacyl-CoA racemase